ncbi:MAG: anti-sigma factor [Sphingomicrobium sp.]
MVSDETFFAWLDGELEPREAARVAAEVEADPELAAKAERHRALRTRLTDAFAVVAEARMPEPISAAVRPGEAEVVDLAAVRRSREPRWGSLRQWAALAATLAVGVFVGTMVPQRSDAPVAVQGGQLYAASALDQALDAQLASAPSGPVRIGLTFRDRSGVICRTFTDAAASGLACRAGDQWRLRGLFAAPEGQAGSYRMAGGMDPGLAALVNSTMAAEPLDAAAEAAAKDQGWR